MCSGGDSTAKAAEQSQANFSNTLQQIFTKQYGQQSAILNFLTNKLEPQIENPQGYSDTALNSMRTSATDQIATQYQNAQKALQNQQFENGGENLPSGVNEMQTGALRMGQASDTAAAQNQITQQNEQLKEQNYWNAVDALSGNASQYNPQSYAGASTSAGNSVAGLSQAYTASNQSQLLGALGGIAGGAGSALAGYFKA